jgi:RimJ/RimL family protein N-acetyltransferase
MSLQQEEDFIERVGDSKNDVWWIIEAEGKAIGATGIHRIEWINAHAITGTIIGDKSCGRKVYGSESMALRTKYAFRHLNLHKLKSGAIMDNEPSKRAAEGRVPTGRCRARGVVPQRRLAQPLAG